MVVEVERLCDGRLFREEISWWIVVRNGSVDVVGGCFVCLLEASCAINEVNKLEIKNPSSKH